MSSTSVAPGLAEACARTLTAWQAPDAEQARLRALYLEHLGRHGDGWSRSCRGAHVTASSLIWASERQQVLLTLHAKIGRWLQTGGHLEPADGSLEAAALREALEESGLSGLRLDPVPLLLSRHEVSCGGQPTFHLDVQFLVLASEVVEPRFGAESLDVRWFPARALPEVDASVRQLVEAAVARQRPSRATGR